MRVTTSKVHLGSSQINIQTYSKTEYLHAWDRTSDTKMAMSQSNSQAAIKKISLSDRADIAALKSSIIHNVPQMITPQEGRDALKNLMDGSLSDFRLQIIKDILEILTGEKIDVLDPASLTDGSAPLKTPAPDAANTSRAQRQPQGWGIDYYFNETRYAKEGAAFSASGTVKTSDGKAIDFSVSLEMTKESLDQRTVSLKAGDALVDPLVINLTGTGVSFSEAKFAFDLKATGASSLISVPVSGNGFLAYDKNGNGLIDNGSELFGPATGSGFGELAALDDDHNGWIDETDSVYNSLKIWEKNADGADSLETLRDKGVGALYCGNADTRFDLTAGKDASAPLSAKLKATGVWLKENGDAGILQEVDLVA